jgi:CheY-like chemotaxis protein
MNEPIPDLSGLRILIVEDEYLIAMDLADRLGDLGAEVIGPAGSVAEALAVVAAEGNRIDGAVLDVNLRNERVYPVADALAAQGIRFVFASGYDVGMTPAAYAGIARHVKPIDAVMVARYFAGEVAG